MLTLEAIETIKNRIAQGEALREIAPDFGVSYTTIWNIKRGKYSTKARTPKSPVQMNQKIRVERRSFADLSPEEQASRIELDIRTLARKWKWLHKTARASAKTAATQVAATYLQKHHELYFRDDRWAMKEAHHHWMMLMEEWFLSTVEKRR